MHTVVVSSAWDSLGFDTLPPLPGMGYDATHRNESGERNADEAET
jgi:hypothetical protein